MKNKNLYKILLLWLIPVSVLYGQEPAGAVEIKEVTVMERLDSLYIHMDMYILSDAVHDRQSLTIIPELYADDHIKRISFPSVLIQGKKKEQLYRRAIRLKDPRVLTNPPLLTETVSPGAGHRITYSQVVPYESWMDTASLRLYQVLGSCRAREQWYILDHIQQVQTEEYMPYHPPVYVNYIEPVKEEKRRMMQGEAFLDFRAGQSVILPEYRRNPLELEKINTTVSTIYNDAGVEILSLVIEGLASPDGSVATNETLAFRRATALKNYLKKRFNIPETVFRIHAAGEDWEGFERLMEESYLADKDRILSVIRSQDPPDRKEQRLKTPGHSWQVLMNDYFPRLRRVKYQIDYSIRDFTAEEAETLMQKNPGHLNLSELFTVAETYPVDSEKWHEIMSLSVLLFPDDPVANINAAASCLIRGEWEQARKHLEKVMDDPRAGNNLAVLYLQQANPEMAEQCLAGSAQLPVTDRNREEIEKVKEDQRKQLARKQR